MVNLCLRMMPLVLLILPFYLSLIVRPLQHSLRSSLKPHFNSLDVLNEHNVSNLDRTFLAHRSNDSRRRMEYNRIGTKRLLVIRVSNKAESPIETLDEIQAAVFGTTRNDDSLCAQMRAVSHGALVYVPVIVTSSHDNATLGNASHSNSLIRAGVLDMEIDVPTMMDTSGTYEHFNAVVKPAMVARMEHLLQQPWHQVADHVLFCLPTGTLREQAAAMGDVGGPFTYYHFESCTKLQVLMHEMGHNLNFLHGDVNGHEYADYSGYMGGNQAAPTWRERLFTPSRGFPKKGFNGFNHWQSGWFQDRAVEVDPLLTGGSSLHRVASFVEYGNAALRNNHAVLIKVGSLYIQYNRAKGYNRDTPVPDAVTITQAWSEHANSNRVAGLKQGGTYTAYNFSSTTSLPLIIQVCTVVREPAGVLDFVDVSLHLDDGTLQSSCPPHTGGKSAGSGESVALTSMVLGALQVSDPVRTTLCVLFIVSFLVVSLVCLDACCVAYVLGRCRGTTQSRKGTSVAPAVEDTHEFCA